MSLSSNHKLDPFEVIPALIGPLSTALSQFRRKRNCSDALIDIIETIEKICTKAPDATLAAVHLLEIESPLKQPLFSSILGSMLCARLKYDIDHRTKLLQAILTANISLNELQVLLNRSDNPLTDTLREQIKQHPLESRAILEEAGITDPLWLKIVEQHHERADGNGYPHQLIEEDILDDAFIVSLGEFYTAMIDKRAYRSAKSSQVALRELFEKSATREKRIQANFIRVIGVFPPGTYVKLANGEIAIVWKRNADHVMPFVKALFEPSGKPYMGGLTRDCTKAPYKITSAYQPSRKPTLDVSALWQ